MNYLNKLKEKCNLNNQLIQIIQEIFDKLVCFGYITPRQVKRLERKLYENVDVVLFDSDVSHDYKTGYYDAVKKELYIKDINNLESVYLRILYAITTTELSNERFTVGYSTACLSNKNYKIVHSDFGINRAIVSNLVCRLLYAVPTTLNIVPTYRSYENDFLGNKISCDNDIYFLEGKLLSQICFVLNVDEEELYYNLFLNPKKYLEKFLAKSKLEQPEKILELLDYISRKYSNYNKLVYLNKLLDTNYINIRKNILNNNVEKLEKERRKIQNSIQSTLAKLTSKKIKNDDDFSSNIELSLSGEINSLEEEILNSIIQLQNVLVESLIAAQVRYPAIPYTIKLKTFEKILIVENADLTQQIYNTITYKVLNTFENTASNLIEKMKYSIASEVLSSEKYIKIYKNMKFKRLYNLSYKENTSIAAISVDDSFMQLVEISNLNKPTKSLRDNIQMISLDNLGYLLNTLKQNQDLAKIEKIYSTIKEEFKEFAQTRIENIYIANLDASFKLLIIAKDNDFSIIKLREVDGKYKCRIVKLSESYSIFNQNSASTLPVVYRKNHSPLKRVLSFLAIFS